MASSSEGALGDRAQDVPRRILIVEDTLDDALLALRALKSLEPRPVVETVDDGEMALSRLLDPRKPLPDLVLLDLNIPLANGLEVLRTVRADQRARVVPIVVLSSSSEPNDVAACYRALANGYLVKPVDFEEYMNQLNTAFQYWIEKNVWPREPLG